MAIHLFMVQVLQANVSEPRKIANNGFCWEILVQGQVGMIQCLFLGKFVYPVFF